jgi:hypothetical protein
MSIVEVNCSRHVLGFFDASTGSPIPTIERNKPITLAVDNRVWSEGIKSITVSGFKAWSGKTWDTLHQKWPRKTIKLTKSGSAPKSITLKTKFRGGPRMITNNVKVTYKDGRVSRFVDPWDERPGGGG